MKYYCGNCKEVIPPYEEYCPNCHSKISHEEFSILIFLQENFQYFVIIGVIGTLTVLLPSVAKIYYYNYADLSAIPWPQGFLLLASLVLNSLFLLILMWYVFIKTIIERPKEIGIFRLDLSIFRLIFRIGDTERLLFYITTIIPLAITSIFLANIFPLLRNLIYYEIAIAFLIILYWTAFIKYEERKKRTMIVLVFLIIVFFVWTIYGIWVVTPKENTPINIEDINIQYDVELFNPQIVGSYGIGLLPSNITAKDFSEYNIFWRTNYGYFINISPSDGRIKLLGNCTLINNDNIYWTYSLSDYDKPKPNVSIFLTIEKKSSNIELKNSSLNLSWTDINAIKVIKET